jgi:hypothetical protein
MKRKTIAIIALITGIYSCRHPNDVSEGFVYSINLDDAVTIERPLLSEFCDEVETIIMETADDALLSRIIKILRVNDDLYLLDSNPANRGAGSVVKFYADGKFAKRYGNVGRGPGEYISLSDFTIDKQSGLVYLIDRITNRLISHDSESGKFAEDVALGKMSDPTSNIIASIGSLIYVDMQYRQFDKSNYMLRSWNKADPAQENFYLPVDEHLKGWTNTALTNNNNFIFIDGNESALFSNRYSPEIFKVVEGGVIDYIYIQSKDFIDDTLRETLSAVQDAHTSPDSKSPWDILHKDNRFSEVRDYFETNKNICFYLSHGNTFPMFIYNKDERTTQRTTSLFFDLIVKNDEVHSVFTPLHADKNGIYIYVRPEMTDKLRTAAREGMLVDGLDRLDELKELADDANPVLFYMKFKDPLR